MDKNQTPTKGKVEKRERTEEKGLKSKRRSSVRGTKRQIPGRKRKERVGAGISPGKSSTAGGKSAKLVKLVVKGAEKKGARD